MKDSQHLLKNVKINESETILKKIENHPHYCKCFNGNEYSLFNDNCSKFYKTQNNYKKIIDLEREIISEYYKEKEYNQKYSNLKQIYNKELESLNQKLKCMEELKSQENENKINDLKNKYLNNEFKIECELKELDKEITKEITNLKNEFKLKNEKYNNELELKKKEYLFQIENEYKIKEIQYINNKKLEFQEKEKNDAIKKMKFDAQNEIELNTLKNKANFVKKVISIYKNISLQ